MRTYSFLLFALVLIGLGFYVPANQDVHLCLRWTEDYQDDTWEKKRTGLLWNLSFLGARLPEGSLDRAITKTGKQEFDLNLSALGFEPFAMEALRELVDSIRNGDTYRKSGAIDLGEFVMLTEGSSWHYYRITGASKTYQEFWKKHHFDEHQVFPVTRSSVSAHHRLIRFRYSDTLMKQAFIAEESEGDLLDNTFSAGEYEVLDFMANGQPRFAIYDREGNLSAGGHTKYGSSGKPAKCLWCHESAVLPLFGKTDTIENYMSPDAFQAMVWKQREVADRYRATLHSDLDFGRTQDHTYSEILYISYMEPSLVKLSQEWNIPLSDLEKQVDLNIAHRYNEFPFLGQLYHRDEIRHLAPFMINEFPRSIREQSDREPNYFRH